MGVIQPIPFFFIMDALELLEVIEQLDVTKVATEAFAESTDDYVRLNREQMMEGKTITGDDISPSYFEDPFFKTPEAAKKYSDWKDKITPNPKRKKGVPNLYITGPFHQSLQMEVEKDEYLLSSDYKDAESILSKFDDVLGLNDEKREKLIDGKLGETFYDKLHEETGL
jgi:hypothetical protein